jgi:hypothetical protein
MAAVDVEGVVDWGMAQAAVTKSVERRDLKDTMVSFEE